MLDLVPPVLRRDSYAAATYIGALGAAAVIGLYGLARLLAPTADRDPAVAGVDAVVVTVCLLVARLASRGSLRTAARQNAAMLTVLSVITAGVLVESLIVPQREPQLLVHYLLCLAVGGVVMRSWRLHLTYLVAFAAAWLLLHLARDNAVLDWLPTFLVAGGMSCVVHAFTDTVYRTTRERELRARAEARVDELTGLPNRLGLADQVRRLAATATRAQTPVWGAFIDVDHFKQVNDTLGHAAGDELLKAVGRALLGAARGADAVARWGGDEFVLLGLGDPPAAEHFEARLAAALHQDNPLASGGWTATVTAGVAATGPAPDRQQVEEMLAVADARMYERRTA